MYLHARMFEGAAEVELPRGVLALSTHPPQPEEPVCDHLGGLPHRQSYATLSDWHGEEYDDLLDGSIPL